MVKFDKEKALKALNESLIDRFPRLIPPGRSGLFVYRGDLPLDRIARGMAAAGKRPTNIIRLQSEDLQRGEGWKLLDPLLHGSMLIVLDEGASSIGANLAAYWPRFADNPKGYAAPITKTLMLDHRLSIESPGAVVVIQRTSTNESSHDLMEWPLIEEDAVALTALADSWTSKIATIGRRPSERITFSNNEEAYRAYRALVRDIVATSQSRILAETIAAQAIRGADALNLEISFHANKIDLQLYDALYYRLTGLSEHSRSLHGGFREDEALPDVYAAALIISRVWKADPEYQLVYRGQRNSTWRLLPSYFRPRSDGTPPDLDARQKRLRRVERTDHTGTRDLDAALSHSSRASRQRRRVVRR